MLSRISICFALSGLALVGCGDPLQAPGDQSSKLRSSVVPGLQRDIDGTGRFFLSGQSAGEISGSLAERLAEDYWDDAKLWIGAAMEKQRGTSIHIDDLKSCGRPIYAASAYGAIPSDAPTALKHVAGSHWIVGLCYGTTQEVAISVAASNGVEHTGKAKGRLRKTGNATFYAMGVPLGARVPMSPEALTIEAASSSDRLVSALPRLVMQPLPKSPFFALWEIQLASTSSKERTILYAGPIFEWTKGAFALSTLPKNNAIRPSQAEPVERDDAPRNLKLVSLGGLFK